MLKIKKKIVRIYKHLDPIYNIFKILKPRKTYFNKNPFLWIKVKVTKSFSFHKPTQFIDILIIKVRIKWEWNPEPPSPIQKIKWY
jgi:hypothetical protein